MEGDIVDCERLLEALRKIEERVILYLVEQERRAVLTQEETWISTEEHGHVCHRPLSRYMPNKGLKRAQKGGETWVARLCTNYSSHDINKCLFLHIHPSVYATGVAQPTNA